MPQYVIGSASARNVCGWTARNLRRESCLSYNWRWPIAKCVFAPASLRPQSRPRCTCPCRVPHPCGEIRSVLPAQRSECTGCLMLDEAHRVAKQASQSVAQHLPPFSHTEPFLPPPLLSPHSRPSRFVTGTSTICTTLLPMMYLKKELVGEWYICLLYTSPSPRD